MAKKFHLPAYMRATPEDEAEQASLRASRTRAKLSPEERMLSHGRAVEQMVRENLTLLHEDLKNGIDRTEALKMEEARLADALALQGRFQSAAMCHPDPERKKEYRDIMKAIDRPDEKRCRCADRRAFDPLSGQELSISTRYIERYVYSRDHKRVMPIIACDSCGFKNATEPSPRLAMRDGSPMLGIHTGTPSLTTLPDSVLLLSDDKENKK